MFRRKRFLIGSIILILAMGYVMYAAFGNTLTYYSTIGELLAEGSTTYGKTVRVNGNVVPGSIDQDTSNFLLRFSIEGEGGSLWVVYRGVEVPDAFKEGIDVVVEGKLNSDGIFQANQILVKCPSTYNPEEE